MSDVQIHPTAIIDPRAEIGAGTIIGPYCVIGPDVVLGQNCWLQHHVTLCGPMTAGAKNKFYAYSSIGQQTQYLKYQGEPTVRDHRRLLENCAGRSAVHDCGWQPGRNSRN